jgi:type IV pilus assembly protein PilB
MAVSEEIRELILRRGATDEISRAAKKQGMDCLRDEGLLKAAQGTTTLEGVLRTVVMLRPNARELRALVV